MHVLQHEGGMMQGKQAAAHHCRGVLSQPISHRRSRVPLERRCRATRRLIHVRASLQQPLAEGSSRQRVCIIGGGCAGLTAAWSLSRHPERYEVEVWEASNRWGGHANTLPVLGSSGKKFTMNDTVIGGTYAGFANSLMLLKELGWQGHHFDIPVAFAGAGAPGDPDYLWSTAAGDWPLFQRHARDISRFISALEWLWRSKQVLLLLLSPLRLLCQVLGCSGTFWDEMVAPLGVIFFGTGQRMDACPAIILAGAVSDPSAGAPVLQLDTERLIKPVHLPFFNFPRLDLLYTTLLAKLAAAGNIQLRLNQPATAVYRRGSQFRGSTTGAVTMASSSSSTTGTVTTASTSSTSTSTSTSSSDSSDSSDSSSSSGSSFKDNVVVVDADGRPHVFDDVIMACHAPAALKLLQQPTWMDRVALGEVEYHRQSTIMHTDEEFIKKYHPALLEFDSYSWSVQLQATPGNSSSSSNNSSSSVSSNGSSGNSVAGVHPYSNVEGIAPGGYELVYQFIVSDLEHYSDTDLATAAQLGAPAVLVHSSSPTASAPVVASASGQLQSTPTASATSSGSVVAELSGSRAPQEPASSSSTSAPQPPDGQQHQHRGESAAAAVVTAGHTQQEGVVVLPPSPQQHLPTTEATAAGAVVTAGQTQQEEGVVVLPAGTQRLWQVSLPVGNCLQRLDPDKVLSIRTWEHPAHTVKHFMKTLALWRLLQGQGGVFFAGGYTFVDTQEYATISGLAAAEQLGAPYPWPQAPKALEAYSTYKQIVYG